MRFRSPHILYIIFLFFVVVASPLKSLAQNHDFDEEVTRDTANNFCKRLSSIMLQTESDFEMAKEVNLENGDQKVWDCKESFKMKGAKHCTIYQSGGKTTYVAMYMTKEEKEKLGSSYNNLLHQIKDCFGYNYEYKEKQASITDKFTGNVNFECEMYPHGDGVKEQADMRVSVQKDPSGSYVLMLEIMKYKGYYMDRRVAVPQEK